jgi:16S rRNA (cytidine1402-2'-O)-methyltransferase
MTYRAVRILKEEVEWIACEDTRQTAKLLTHYSIHRPLVSYHEHNEAARTAELIAKLEAGSSGALVSDAGTPLLSDPGYRLVEEAAARGLHIVPLPGASAALAALMAAGLPTDQFLFIGFLPPKRIARQKRLAELREEATTVVFYESPHRVLESLADIAEVLGDRPLVVARELTKLHEEFLRGTAKQVGAELASRDSVRGEFTVLLAGPGETPVTGDPAEEVARLEASGHSRMDAIKAVARQMKLPKREVYRLAEARSSSSPDTRHD